MQKLDSQAPNTTVVKYLKNLERSNKNTASDHRKKLYPFRNFVLENYDLTLDQLITTLTHYSHGPKIDVYDMFSDYASYLLKERSIAPISLKLMISVVRSFLETFDVEVSPRKFKLKVGLPRVIRTHKEALQKSDIQTILNACPSIKLKTYVMLLAATGCRASEALSIRICDINFSKDPVTVFIRGEFTKTRTDRTIMLTSELAEQVKLWIEHKHRSREITHYDSSHKTYVDKRTPKINEKVLLFSTKYDRNATIDGLYNDMLVGFENTLKTLGRKFAEFEPSGKRRKITLHSFRRFTKTTISDLGHHEFSEYYIGHKGSTYYRVSESEKIKIFRKIEPHLTFLDITALERKGADLSDRLEIMEQENKELRVNINKIMEMIQQNPQLANVKPEVLTKKI